MTRHTGALDQTLQLAGGRTLGYATFGDPAGRPLFYLHGGGSSRLEPAYADGYARRNGIRVIATDRPGGGLSTPAGDFHFELGARDVLELADALQLQRFAAAGMSAGAPYALRLAVLAPQRVHQVCLINPSPDTAHPAWQVTPALTRLMIRASQLPGLFRFASTRLKQDPAKAARGIAARAGWSELEVSQFAAAMDEGLRQPDGLENLRREAQRVLGRPWQLDWSQIVSPVLAVCGMTDPSRLFYREMARRYPNISVMDIPGPHMPIVCAQAWDAIGAAMTRT